MQFPKLYCLSLAAAATAFAFLHDMNMTEKAIVIAGPGPIIFQTVSVTKHHANRPTKTHRWQHGPMTLERLPTSPTLSDSQISEGTALPSHRHLHHPLWSTNIVTVSHEVHPFPTRSWHKYKPSISTSQTTTSLQFANSEVPEVIEGVTSNTNTRIAVQTIDISAVFQGIHGHVQPTTVADSQISTPLEEISSYIENNIVKDARKKLPIFSAVTFEA